MVSAGDAGSAAAIPASAIIAKVKMPERVARDLFTAESPSIDVYQRRVAAGCPQNTAI